MSRPRSIMPLLLPVILVMAGVFYYMLDPRDTSIPMLKCPFHLLTGLSCPACGLQRALHLLLHGHPLEALSYNYFLVLALPLTLLAILGEWCNTNHRFEWAARFVHDRRTLITFIILFFVWGIVRNILHC